MAVRNETISIKAAIVDASAELRSEESVEKRPRNLSAVKAAPEGFSLVVDGKAKSHYSDEARAFDVALTLKQSFPMLQVSVHDAVKRLNIRIELPGAAPDGKLESPQLAGMTT